MGLCFAHKACVIGNAAKPNPHCNVITLTKTLPFGVLRALKNGRQIFQVRQLREVINTEELCAGSRNKWRVGHRSNGCAILKHFDV